MAAQAYIEIWRGAPSGVGLYSNLEGYSVCQRYKAGPRNLIKALDDLAEAKASARAATGVGRAYMTIAGKEVSFEDTSGGAQTLAEAREMLKRYI